MDTFLKEKLVRLAIAEAIKASQSGNSPFGAVLSDVNGVVIAKARNTTNTDVNPTAHAEINLIRKASKKLNTKDLSSYILVSNAQSCPMCFSAAIKSKISNFIYGYAENETLNPKVDVFAMSKFCKTKINIESGILNEECKQQIEEERKG